MTKLSGTKLKHIKGRIFINNKSHNLTWEKGGKLENRNPNERETKEMMGSWEITGREGLA